MGKRMSIIGSMVRSALMAISPSFRNRMFFKALLNDAATVELHEDYVAFCAVREAGGENGSHSVRNMSAWAVNSLGSQVCRDENDFRQILKDGGWTEAIDMSADVRPELFNAFSNATRGFAHRKIQLIGSRADAAALLDANMKGRR